MKLILENWQKFVNETEAGNQTKQQTQQQQSQQQGQQDVDAEAEQTAAIAKLEGMMNEGIVSLLSDKGLVPFINFLRDKKKKEAIIKQAIDTTKGKYSTDILEMKGLIQNLSKFNTLQPDEKKAVIENIGTLQKSIVFKGHFGFDNNFKKTIQTILKAAEEKPQPAKEDPDVKAIGEKYGTEIGILIDKDKDTDQFNSIVLFLVFLKNKNLLRENANPYFESGIFSREVLLEFLKYLDSDKKATAFMRALRRKGMMEFLKKAVKKEGEDKRLALLFDRLFDTRTIRDYISVYIKISEELNQKESIDYKKSLKAINDIMKHTKEGDKKEYLAAMNSIGKYFNWLKFSDELRKKYDTSPLVHYKQLAKASFEQTTNKDEPKKEALFNQLFATKTPQEFLEIYTQIVEKVGPSELAKQSIEQINQIIKLKGNEVLKDKKDGINVLNGYLEKFSNRAIRFTDALLPSYKTSPRRHLEKISKVYLGLAEPAAETEGGTDKKTVDPDPKLLSRLTTAFNEYKTKFYKEKKLRNQASIVNELLGALKAFFEEESAEAYGRRADRDRSKETPDTTEPSVEPTAPEKETPAKRDDLYEEEASDKGTDEIAAKPKDIRNFKTSVRAFQRAVNLSSDLVDKAMEDTNKGKLVGADSRDKVVKFATATQEKIKILNSSINKIMTAVEKGSIEEELNPDIEAKMQKYRETVDRIEDVYETIVGTDIEKGGIGRIVDNLSKNPPIKMSFDEIERGVKKALELLSTIKKFFPSIIPFEGSKIEATDIANQYKKAIAKLDLDSSDIQTLKDVLEGDQGKVAILSFQDRIIEFSKDIERIFGIPGLTEEDSADPEAEREDEEAEEEEAELDALKDGAEKAKAKYASDEFIMSLESEEVKTAFYYLISYFMSKGLITENIADTITKELGEALKVLDLLNPKYAKLVKQVLNDKKKADAFIEMLQRVGAKGIDEISTVAFNSRANVARFLTLKLLKNTTIAARMEELEIKSGSQDENNLLRFLAYMLASDAEFISNVKNENRKAMSSTGQIISGANASNVIKFISQKDKELFNWAKEWFGTNRAKAVKLFKAIKEFLDKKKYKFNTKGLTLAMLQKMDFTGPSEIPEKEEDAIKKVVDKLKTKPKFDPKKYDTRTELDRELVKTVIDVVQNDNNQDFFSWSQEQPVPVLKGIVYDYVEGGAGYEQGSPTKDPLNKSKLRKKYSKLPEFDSWKQMSREQKELVLKAIEKYDDEEFEELEDEPDSVLQTESRLRRAIKKYIIEAILKKNWKEMIGDLKTNDLFGGQEGINLISSFLRDFQDNYGDEIKDDPKGDEEEEGDEEEGTETTEESFKEVLRSLENVFEDQYKQKYTDGKHFLSPDEFPQIEDNIVEKRANIITDMILKSKYPNIEIEIQIGRGGRSEQSIMYKFPQPLKIENSVPDFMGKMNKAIIKPGEKEDDKKKEEPKSSESDDKWKSFFDDEENIKFYKTVNRLYRNVDKKTAGRFNLTDKWLKAATAMLQEDKSEIDFDKFEDILEAAKSFIKIIKTKQTDKLKDKGINSGFARLQRYMKYFERAWKKYKPEDDFPSPPIDSGLEGDDEPSSLLGSKAIDSLKQISRDRFAEDEILHLSRAWEDSLKDSPLEERRVTHKPPQLKGWQRKLKDTLANNINSKHRDIAMKLIKTGDEKLQKILKKISKEQPTFFASVYLKIKKALKKKQTQERLERALRPLIEKLMRGE